MQPLKLPPTSLSPSDSATWKTWDNHLNQNPHTTANYNDLTVDNINSTTYNNQIIYDDLILNNAGEYHPYQEQQQQLQVQPTCMPLQSQTICDPYTYSQLQYQLQYQQLLLQQQQQQEQQQQLHAQLQQFQLSQLMQQLSPQKTASSNTLSPASSTQSVANKTCIEKIFLNAKFVTPAVFNHLSVEIPKLTCHDIYEGFFVAPNPTGYEWDMILRVYYKNTAENKTYIKYYLVHQEYCLRGERGSRALNEASKSQQDCVQFELEVPVQLFNEFDHVVSYMYGHDIYVGDSHLIALFVLIERLSLNGGILEELIREIRRCCDKFHCVSFLLQAEELVCEELVWLCGDSILQNLSTISYYEWLEIPDTAFNRLIYQAVSGGIAKYSDFIVCELIMQYIKAIMSESHSQAKEIIKNLDSRDIKCVSIDHALPLLKICDVLFAECKQQWRYENITVYQLCLRKISGEFTPYHNDLCQQLQGLSPITFAKILISAVHLPQNALRLSLMAYKEGNHAAYYNDKHLRISRLLSERKGLCKQRKGKEVVELAEELSEEMGEQTIVSPLEMEHGALNNGARSRSPPKSPSKSPSKSPQYSLSGSFENELSPCSVDTTGTNHDHIIDIDGNININIADCSQFVYSSPLSRSRRSRPVTDVNNMQCDGVSAELDLVCFKINSLKNTKN